MPRPKSTRAADEERQRAPTPTSASDQRSRMPKRSREPVGRRAQQDGEQHADEGQKDYVDRVPEQHQDDDHRHGDADVDQRVLGGVLALGLVHGFYGPGRQALVLDSLTGLPDWLDFERRFGEHQHLPAVLGPDLGRLASSPRCG